MRVLLLLLVSLQLISCNKDATLILPSNLLLSVEPNEDLNGEVSFIATAENVNFFLFDFGVDEGYVRDDDGVISYNYLSTGDFTVKVRAHTSYNKFIEIEEIVSVEVVTEGGYETPTSYSGYTLFWQDEFTGTSLNTADWNYEIGTGSNGWGNNELQYYRQENTSVANGLLVIEAKQEAFGGRSYTSSRLTTNNKVEFQYGRVDIRAKLPKGQGIWPALWMLGENFGDVGWPACGEIDIMEMVGGGAGKDDTVHGTLHWDNGGSYACTCEQNNSYTLSSGLFYDKFHVFSIVWTASAIQWYVDDELFKTVDITPGNLSEFRNEFFFIFNVAVGGNWPGSPNGSTVFPQRMMVDYVRVFQVNS